MTTNELRVYCLTVKGAEDTSSEGENNFIIKVMSKIFAYTEKKLSDDQSFGIMLKCNPERAVELRTRYKGITAGRGNFAKAWNRVELESDVPDKMIKELVDHSVNEIISSLPKAKREEYLNL